MSQEKIAMELVRIAKGLTAVPDRSRFMKLASKIEAMRGRYELTSDEAVFLSIVRDMASAVGKGRWSKIKSLASTMQEELEADLDLMDGQG